MAMVGLLKHADMRISNEGILHIVQSEGYIKCTYSDIIDINTIGVGATRDITGAPVKPNTCISDKQAAELLLKNITEKEAGVKSKLNGANMPQSVYDAVVSLTFTTGVKGAAVNKKTGKPTRLAAAANAGDWIHVCEYIGDFTGAGGKTAKGLVNRRAKDQTLCLKDLNNAKHNY